MLIIAWLLCDRDHKGLTSHEMRPAKPSFCCHSGSLWQSAAELPRNELHLHLLSSMSLLQPNGLRCVSGRFAADHPDPGKGDRALSKIARRQFLQLSAVAAAGCLVRPGQEAHAQDAPHLSDDDPTAMAMKYTHDTSTVAAGARANPAENQHCGNCALVLGEDGEDWRPCQIFPGKLVAANGWCSVWAPKA